MSYKIANNTKNAILLVLILLVVIVVYIISLISKQLNLLPQNADTKAKSNNNVANTSLQLKYTQEYFDEVNRTGRKLTPVEQMEYLKLTNKDDPIISAYFGNKKIECKFYNIYESSKYEIYISGRKMLVTLDDNPNTPKSNDKYSMLLQEGALWTWEPDIPESNSNVKYTLELEGELFFLANIHSRISEVSDYGNFCLENSKIAENIFAIPESHSFKE